MRDPEKEVAKQGVYGELESAGSLREGSRFGDAKLLPRLL